ncbi:bifunctional riboflavin kinase/FAD synthetase [Candidatus Pelagibacter sp.]|nr:bifunctional riboflavin kinase/FAD synthetase [Candidatus Pelagibacter sp.]
MVNNLKIYKNFSLSKKDKEAIILIGNFDGLHRGHQKLFNKAQSFKKKFKLRIGVITFDPIPKMFFKKLYNYRLSNFNQKIKLLKKSNVDFIINKKFNTKFSKISCLNFIKKILFKKIKPKYIFVSDNFRFGYKRAGDIKLLKSLEKDYNYKIVNPSPLKTKKFIISSTLIRKNLEKGNLRKVKKLLGRSWCIEGRVEKGRQLGKKIGFPTCNIDIKDYKIPKIGVYAVKVLSNDKRKFKGIANIGYRPTFNQKKLVLEVNIFNFSGNLYNKNLSIEFIKFIRGEKKFSGVLDLKKQIKIDCKKAKVILSNE